VQARLEASTPSVSLLDAEERHHPSMRFRERRRIWLVLFAASVGANRAMKRRAVWRSARRGFAPVSGEKWLSLIFRAHSKGRSDRSPSSRSRPGYASLRRHHQHQRRITSGSPTVRRLPLLARCALAHRHAHSDLIQFPINSQSIDSNSVYRAVAARSGPACL